MEICHAKTELESQHAQKEPHLPDGPSRMRAAVAVSAKVPQRHWQKGPSTGLCKPRQHVPRCYDACERDKRKPWGVGHSQRCAILDSTTAAPRSCETPTSCGMSVRMWATCLQDQTAKKRVVVKRTQVIIIRKIRIILLIIGVIINT